MNTQHVAHQSSCNVGFLSDQPQRDQQIAHTYLLHRFSPIFPQGYPQGTLPQQAGTDRRQAGRYPVENRDRRQTCQRASRAFAPCPCWPSWQHAAAIRQAKLKNLWSWTRRQCPSRSSRPLPVNTDPAFTRPGQAFAPVLTHANPTRGAA